jgi:hypothetical protein
MSQRVAVMTVTALSSILWVSRAKAQAVHETVTESGPNRALLSSGLFAVGVPYVASVVVATESDHAGDKNLYLPVVGPWLDLADRGGCNGVGQTPCTTETGNKVLLVLDGIIQGIGALDLVGAFVFPETRTVTVSERPRVFVAPAYLGKDGYGVAALATF